MAITKSAKKAHRQSLRRKALNDVRRDTVRDALKAVRTLALNPASAGSGEHPAKQDVLAAAYQAIDKAAKRGLIKKNTAARRKSKVARALKA